MIKAHVMHVPGERDQFVEQLRETEGIEVCLHEDPRRNGPMWNWIQVLKCMRNSVPDTEWHLQLNDDVYPAGDDFVEHFAEATANSPRGILGLIYVGGKTAPCAKARERGLDYLVAPYHLTGGAIAYHTHVLEGLLEFAAHCYAVSYPHDDLAAAYYADAFMGEDPAMATSALFRFHQTKSFLRHPQYQDPNYHIGNTETEWRPHEVGATARGGRGKSIKTLVDHLRHAGYPTSGVVS